MRPKSSIPSLLESRLGRYAMTAGAVAAATVPAQAAPITVWLPTPIDIRGGYDLDLDNDGNTEIHFSGSGSTILACYFGTANVLVSGSLVLPLNEGDSFDISVGTWRDSSPMLIGTGSGLTFLGIRFGTTVGPMDWIGYAQFRGPNLYGWAYEPTSSTTVFDLQPSTSSVPEPATGALAALALGAIGLAARKRKQA